MKVYVISQYDGSCSVFKKKDKAIKHLLDNGFKNINDTNIYTLEDNIEDIAEHEVVLNDCEVTE